LLSLYVLTLLLHCLLLLSLHAVGTLGYRAAALRVGSVAASAKYGANYCFWVVMG
jgi:hypothetical protein